MLTNVQKADIQEIFKMLVSIDRKHLPLIATGVSMLLARDQLEAQEQDDDAEIRSDGDENEGK